jgi:hypothetical protein
MPIIASVAVGQSIVRVRCSGLDRDPHIDKNILLIDCVELSVEDNDGKPWDTRIWSIPKETLLSYAVGQPYVEPVVEAPPAAPEQPAFTDEQLDALRKRREELREQDRVIQEIARERIQARSAKPPRAKKPDAKPARKPARRAKATPVEPAVEE